MFSKFSKTIVAFAVCSVAATVPQASFAQNKGQLQKKIEDYYKRYMYVMKANEGVEQFLNESVSKDYVLISQDKVFIGGQLHEEKTNTAGKALLISSTLEAQEQMKWKSLSNKLQNIVISSDGSMAKVTDHVTGTAAVALTNGQASQEMVAIIQSTCVDVFSFQPEKAVLEKSNCQTSTTFR